MEQHDQKPAEMRAVIKTPVTLAVMISLFVATIIVAIAVAIGGSYALTLSAINHQQQTNEQQRKNDLKTQNELREREATSQIRTAIPTCRALINLDNAKNGASNASSDPNSYGHRLARAITSVVDDTHCRQLIFAVDHGVSLKQIAKEAQNSGSIGGGKGQGGGPSSP